ncbi:MAG: TolC family protein [Magnetococcales bacterium]|nr:TolC family protein [Magnetococcales bacterium]
MLILDCLGLCAQTAAADVVTLPQLYQLASIRDAAFQMAREQKMVAMERRPQSLARLLPSLSAQASAASMKQRETFPTSYGVTAQTLTLNVPLFHWDNIVDLRQAEKEQEKAILAYATAEQGLVMRVAQRYFDLLLAWETLAVNEAEKKTMAVRLEMVKERLRVGSAIRTDLFEAQAGHDLAQTGVIDAANAVENAEEALHEIVGTSQYLTRLQPLPEPIPLHHPDPDDITAWIANALQSNPGLLEARLDKEIAHDGVSKARAGHLPTLDLVAARNHQNNSAPPQWLGGRSQTDSLMLQL